MPQKYTITVIDDKGTPDKPALNIVDMDQVVFHNGRSLEAHIDFSGDQGLFDGSSPVTHEDIGPGNDEQEAWISGRKRKRNDQGGTDTQ